MPFRVAVLASHPIQYAAPFFRYVAQQGAVDLTVFYASRQGVTQYVDPGFGRPVRWDVELLSGYRSLFLPGPDRRVNGFFSLICPRIVPEVLRGGFDAVLLPGYGHAYYLLGLLAAALAHTPVLLRGETHDQQARPRNARRAIRNALLPWLLSRVDAFLAIGTPQRAFAEHFGVPPERIFLTPYGVDNDFFAIGAAAHRAERTARLTGLGLDATAPVVLYAAKLIERKRPGDLLDAYARLRDRGVQASLLVVGDGPLKASLNLRALALGLEGIRFLGFQNQSEILAWYGISDVFALPSAEEAWGLVVNEAMCAGLPVIATRETGSSYDLVQPGVTGFTYLAGDVRSLTDHLTTLCADRDLRQRMGRASLERIRKWSFAEAHDGLVAALQAVTQPARPAGVITQTRIT
jgi:glycosyltransferase involved in cell wall biosynthesis